MSNHNEGPALVAGVDSSTQSAKVEIRELESGRVVARAGAPHTQTTPPRSEQDPAVWWSAFEAAWAAVGAPEVEAISVAGQQHGMVVLDECFEVVRPAKLWNDTESAPDAGWLLGQLDGGATAWASAVGSVPVAALTISKLSWLHRSEPESWARLAHVVLPHDWMTHRLCGAASEPTTDRGDASGTGYWSPISGTYRWDLLSIVDRDRDWRSVVPRVAAPRETVGSWGTARVAVGTGDNMAAALGIGLGSRQAVVSLGTSGTAYTVADQPTSDSSGGVAGFADASGRYLPLVCTLNAGKVLDAIARVLGVDHPMFDELARGAPLGAGGVVLLPYLDGERTPNLPAATGWLSGLRSDVTREQLAQAAVEGVVCGMLEALDSLALHAPIDSVVLTGGGARSRAVRETFAALCSLPVATAEADEAVATGAAVQAAAIADGVDHGEIISRWGLGRTIPVEITSSAAAGEIRARFVALREAAYPA